MIEFSEHDTLIILDALKEYQKTISNHATIGNYDILDHDVNTLIKRIEMNNEDRHIRNIWRTMLDRCRNPNNKSYSLYGERGITVCVEWHHLKNFKTWCYENGYKIGLTIDRINSDGNYEPANCRIATQKTQQRNRRNNHVLTDPFDGERLCMTAIAEKYNMTISCLSNRINAKKMNLEDALTKPVRKVSKITDNKNNKMSVRDKIIIWHDNILKNGETYTAKRIAEEIGVKKSTVIAATAASHNETIANWLKLEFQYKDHKRGNLYIKRNNWNKDGQLI